MLTAPKVFKVAVLVTFLSGFTLHVIRLSIGPQRMVHEVLTPPVDAAFGALMLFAGVAGWSWKRYAGGRGGKIGLGVMLFVLLASLPLHVRALITWNTDFVLALPAAYSIAELPLFAGLVVLVVRLRFKEAVQAFAEKAKAAGVVVQLTVEPDMIHNWHLLASLSPVAVRSIEQAGAFIRNA